MSSEKWRLKRLARIQRVADEKRISPREAAQLLRSRAEARRAKRRVARKAKWIEKKQKENAFSCVLCGQAMVNGQLWPHLKEVHGQVPAKRMNDVERALWEMKYSTSRILPRLRFVSGGLPSLGKRR